ncbi:T9SS type A sorting domain-containing protein [Aureibaculum algae]|uniref:T9SS type A sorting domain-containing protein n=1 Tax=Aureibaculum algae TaxID=2584122 RepID=A0A5B7TWB2_9FLAO|nr:T9SS type A sorting domain-containing protein [Aureibaculum algae]QCX40630.1 T9SS type A sorting domain-containing protein [Aureibaculum algae]
MGLKFLIGMLLFMPSLLFAATNSNEFVGNISKSYIKVNDTVGTPATTVVEKTELQINNATKVTSLEKKAVRIFPNPVKDVLIVGSLNASKDAVNTVHVFNNLGQVVYENSSMPAENNQIKIKTESLKPGVYYLKVNKGSISKFIKI